MSKEIHPTAVVDASAKIGEGVIIGPHTIIEGSVEIGENTRIDSQAKISYGARIGKNCHIFHGAVISEIPQDLNLHRRSQKLSLSSGNPNEELFIDCLQSGGFTF